MTALSSPHHPPQTWGGGGQHIPVQDYKGCSKQEINPYLQGAAEPGGCSFRVVTLRSGN